MARNRRRASCATGARRPCNVRAAVFLNGVPESRDILKSVAGSVDLIVAADGGAVYAMDAGIVPDLIVGDMDSLGEERARAFESRGAKLERHPVEKDKMDGQLAIQAARDRGATSVDLLCATGGRFSADVALPHILLAAERMGLRATVVAGWGRAFVVEDGSRTVEGSRGDSVSVFPLGGAATGVTLEGMAYPLRDARLEAGDTLGFHNELTDGMGWISVGEGALLVVHETEDHG